jgi:aldose 1-epimerase
MVRIDAVGVLGPATPLHVATIESPTGMRLRVLDAPALRGGLDHAFARSAGDAPAAVLHDPSSGRTLDVRTSAPGLHVYTANSLRDTSGKGGRRYQPHDGICLEAQQFPDAPNRPDFPDRIVRPGVPYAMRTAFRFTDVNAPRRGD